MEILMMKQHLAAFIVADYIYPFNVFSVIINNFIPIHTKKTIASTGTKKTENSKINLHIRFLVKPYFLRY